MHGLFSIPLNLFIAVVAPPDSARLHSLETGLDTIARNYELTDREARTLKDSFVEPFRQEGMLLGPDTVQWLQILNRRLLGLPPGAVSAGAELQWTTLDLERYAGGKTFQQYLYDITGKNLDGGKAQEAAAAAAPVEKKKRAPRKRKAKA
jgi:hypothetical protein